MSPDAYCQQKALARGSSLYYALLFLPPARRRAVVALYAFCRELNDVVDTARDPQLAATKLAWWRTELGRLFAGTPQHPVTRALAAAVESCGLDAARLAQIIDGRAMDLSQTRYLDFAGLLRYCDSVASPLQVAAAGIFGHRDARTLEYAHALGTALQLTRILRDVGADARRNRIYLPLDALREHAVRAADLLNARHGEAFVAMMRAQSVRAHDYYDRALAALPANERRAQRPGLIMAAHGRTLLVELERDGFRVLDRRTALTPMRKLWLATRTWFDT
ncbi:MAG: presqualene diphosphate synthase HpnD [Proteobacteria bacterium]|nr:presqualene diphosphate synthase HpnD [Pseudomonadota bacterium]